MGNTSVGSGKKPPPLTSTGTAPDAPEAAAAIAYAVAQEAAVQGFPSEGGGADTASSPQETRLQKTLQWLPSFNVSSFLFPASSTLPSPTAAAASGAAAAAAFTSAAAASSAPAEAGEALGAVMGLKQEDFACSFFDSPFSATDAQYFPCDGSPQHAVFRSTQGLWLHAYFWFPSGAAAEAASLSGNCSQHPPCAAPRVSVEEELFVDATSSAGVSPPLQQDEQKGLVQQQPPQQQGKESQKTEKEEGEEGQQQQTQTEWERACAAASCRGVVILLHGYSGHGRLSYLKKVLPKDYVRQHPSWGSYVAAVPSASSTYSYSSCSTLSPPSQGGSAHSKGSSYSSGKGRAGRAAAAMAAALAPCDVDFPEQPACVSRLAAAAGRQGTAAAGEKKLEKEAKAAAAAAAGAATEAEVVQASGGAAAAAAAAEKAKSMEQEGEAAPAAGRGGGVFAGAAAAWERQEVLGPTAPTIDEEKGEATAGNESVTAAKKREGTEKKEAAAAREDTAAAEGGDGRVDRAGEKEQQQKGRQASEEENASSTATPAVLYKGSWAEALTSAGFIVAALDMQGHGLSEGWEGKRAAVRRLDDFAVDVVQFAHIAVQHCRGLRATYYDLQQQQQRRQQQKPQQGGPLTRGDQEEQASKRKDTHEREESRARQRTLPEQEGRLQDARVAALAGARHGAARAPEDNAAAARGVAADAADAAVEAKENGPAIGSGSATRREEAFAAIGGKGQGAREVVPEDFERKEERTAAREEEPEEGEDPPVFLMGLSLGGAVALRTVQLLCEAAVQQNEAAAKVGGRGNKKKGFASGEDWTFRESSPSSSVAAAPAPATAEEEPTREKKNAAGRRTEVEVVKRGGSRSNMETGRPSLKLAGCVLLSPMLDLEGIKARTEYCQSVLRPTLRLLKKYLPHVVVTKKEAYVKYPFQQQMMNDDPYSYKGGLRASMACEMLDAADQLLGQERLRCMQQPQACCPPLLVVHNFFDTTCGFRGPVKLFEQLPAHTDKTLFLLNASVSRRRCSSSNTGGGSKTSAQNSSGGDDGKSSSDSSKSVASSNSHSTESRSSDESSSRNSNSSSTSGSSSSSSTSCKGNPSTDLGGKEAGSEYTSGLPRDQDGDACVPRREIQQSCVEGGWGCDSKEASEYAAARALSGGEPEVAGIHKVVLLDETKKKEEEDADSSSSSRTAAPSVAKGSMKRGPGESSSESEAPADDRGEKAQHGDSGRGADSSTGVSCSPAAKEADGEAHRDVTSGRLCDASHAEEEQRGHGSKRSSGNSGGNISGADAGPGEGVGETVLDEEMQCEAFLSTVPPAFNVDVATLKKLQVYADPELHELDVFHGLPLDPENEKVLQRVLLWLLQRAPSRRGIR